MDDIINCFKQAFATNFQYYTKAHGYHVNVIGTDFYEYHKLLQKIYEDAIEQVDPLGEFIRTIGEQAPETIQDILDGSELPEDTAYDADSMLKIVYEAQEYMMDEYKELFDLATEETDQDIANYAADRIGVHAKFAWMLRSTLEE